MTTWSMTYANWSLLVSALSYQIYIQLFLRTNKRGVHLGKSSDKNNCVMNNMLPMIKISQEVKQS